MKLKRFLTGVLSAVMALSVCALPAAAADVADTTTTAPSTSTIDTGKKGSITIHKYLMENIKGTKAPNNGEAINTTDKTVFPEGAKAASGAQFTIYQVMSKDDLIKYYNGELEKYKNSTPAYTEFVEENPADGTYKIKAGVTVNGSAGTSETTNTDGVAEFKGLELGLYVVIETKTPPAVTKAVTPFLVSVPMTKVETDANSKKTATEWLYDIHVYPKNSTATGSVTLMKKGVIGNDTANATPLAGVEFKLEHLKDGQDETKGDNWEQIKNGNGDYFTTAGTDGSVTISGLNPGKYRFTEIGYATGSENKFIINNGAKYVFEVTAGGNNKVTVSKPADANNNGDYKAEGDTVTVYNYAPDVDKQVYNTKESNYKKVADCGIDDTIKYQVKVVLPENFNNLKKFILTDTPVGIVDDENSVEIYSKLPDASNSQEAKLAKGTDYTVKKNGDGFIVTFEMGRVGEYKGQTLFVCYTAKLKTNEDGTLAGTTSTTGNPNTIDLTYSNKIDITQGKEDDDENKSHIKDDAVVYSFEIDVTKTADTINGDALPGVKFDLYKQVEKGKDANALKDTTAKNYGFDTTSASYVLVKSDLTTDDEGKISYKGLANGTYWLRETKTVDGYNLLASPVKVELNLSYKLTWEENKGYKNNTLVKHDYTQKVEDFGKKATTTTGADRNTYGIASANIVNKKGFQLPVTGGFGTLLFSGIGVLLVLAGVAVLFSMKKKNDRA
ncbi:SpaH/EbpB family LPXTG-anchored major pilin [Gemmiger sp.]|uniref:SpaH/EbpB family LPXTG-anchored major pilin n=1 Tax=Gemmiger sp. TaxID=2049027 RepID=UPI003A944B07